MGRRKQQYLLVNDDAEYNERPSLGGGGEGEGESSSLQPERASSSTSSSSSPRRTLSFSTPRRSRSSDSAGALTVSTASLNDYYSSDDDDDFDVEDFMATEATDDDDIDDTHVVDVDLAASSNNNDAWQVWGRTIQVEAPCALPAGYVFTVDVVNGQQLLVEVPDDIGVVVEGQVFEATIVHVVNETNNDVDYERMYNLDPATRTSQLQQQQQQQPRQAQRPAKQQQENSNSNNNNKKKNAHPIPRGAWRDGLFQCWEHGLFHPVLCIAFWCCSPWLLGQVLTRMKLDACGNSIVKKQKTAETDKLQEQVATKTSSSSSSWPSLSFWTSNNNAFYTIILLLMLHVVLIEHILSMFIMFGLSDLYDVMHHPTWVWMLLFIRATCRCSFLLYMVVVTMKTRRYIRQKYQIPTRSAYCCRSIRGSGGGVLGSIMASIAASCRYPCRRKLHVYGKQQAVTASDNADNEHHDYDNSCAATCEDCCLATVCNCCTIMQMARHTADYTTSRATCCTPNGLP
jgi:hypothetical protein